MPSPKSLNPHAPIPSRFQQGKRIPSLYRWGGVFLTIVAAVYFLDYALRNGSALISLDLDAPSLGLVAAAFGLYELIMVASAIAWLLLLRAVGEKPRVVDVLAVSLVSQFAKYVAGNIAHHVGRIALACARGFDVSRVVVTMGIETGWVVFTGATISAITILMGIPAVLADAPQMPAAWQIAFVGVVGAVVPFAGARILDRWRPGPIRRMLGADAIRLPPMRVMLSCFAIYAGNYLLMGTILYFLVRQVSGQPSADYWLLTGIFAVAWIAGFIVPGAPGGLGVREAVLLATLGPLYGEVAAVAIAVLLRVITIAGDGLGFGLGLVIQFASRKAHAAAASDASSN